MKDLYDQLSTSDKLRMAEAAKELMDSEVALFVFDELDYRIMTALKENTCNSEKLIQAMQSLNNVKTQLQYWAHQCETQAAAVEAESRGDTLV